MPDLLLKLSPEEILQLNENFASIKKSDRLNYESATDESALLEQLADELTELDPQRIKEDGVLHNGEGIFPS